MGGAARTDDRLLTIPARFAPLEHVAEGVALAGAEVIDDRADVWTEGLPAPYPGSDFSMIRLPNDESITRPAGTIFAIDIACSSIFASPGDHVNPTHCLTPRRAVAMVM